MRCIKVNRIFFIAMLLFIFSRCSTIEDYIPSCCVLSIPKPQLTGQKTAIERQIIGDYRELEKDAWIISSVKTNVKKGEGVSTAMAGDEELFLAMKIREFHEDKIKRYKNEGAIGERYNGFIVYRQRPKYESNKNLKEILSVVIEEENKARKTIFEKNLIRAGIKKPGGKEIEAFGRIFAEEQRALARKNDWIEEKPAAWVRKK